MVEAYVSFEVAKLLQKKGFDGRSYRKYNSQGDLFEGDKGNL